MAATMQIALILKAVDQMSAVVDRAMSRSITAMGQAQARMKRLSDESAAFGRSSLGAGIAAGAAVLAPLKAFSDLETATTDLRIAMMDNLGQVPKQFEEINRQAVQLGNVLPGTTADFIDAARALIEQGTGFDTIINGGLKSASYLSVLLKMPAREAAEMVAKLREAYGLADSELEKMADLTQRARFAFGMTPEDIKIASSYSGATQNILGLKGIENARQLLALQGLGAGVSLEGGSWGTNFSMMLARMADSKDRLMKNSKEMRAVNEDLKQAGISLDFFGDQGKFLGLTNMVQQLEKLNKLSDVDRLNALKRIFGQEAARPAAIIGQKGMAGFQEAQQRMERQADLQRRIDVSLHTLRNTWDALAGTVVNALAMIGEPVAATLGPIITRLNEIVSGPLMAWIDQHKKLVGIVGVSVLAFAALAAGLGIVALAFAGLARGVMMALAFGRGLLWIGRGIVFVLPYLVRLGGLMAGPLAAGLRLAGQALLWFGRALLLNPIGLAIAAIGVAAYLIYKHWATIKSVLMAGWAWLKGLASSFREAGANLIQGLVDGIMSRLNTAKAAIMSVGASIKGWFTSTLGIHSPSRVFMDYGTQIAAGAALGIRGGVPQVRQASHGMALATVSAYGPVAMPRQAGGTGAGGSMTVHFAPTINVQGTGDVGGQVRAAMADAYREFEANMRRWEHERARRAF